VSLLLGTIASTIKSYNHMIFIVEDQLLGLFADDDVTFFLDFEK
jgi:hypothetical protein